MTYEFIYEFMYMKNIVKSYLNQGSRWSRTFKFEILLQSYRLSVAA